MKLDRNTVIGLLLMALFAFGFTWYMSRKQLKEAENAPAQQEQVASQPTEQTTPATAAPAVSQDTTVVLNTNRYGTLATAARGEEKFATLSNKHLNVKLSTKGGSFHSAELKDFTIYNSDKHVQLWDTTNNVLDLVWKRPSGEVVFSDELFFEPSTYAADASNGAAQVRMRANGSNPNQYMEWVYTLEPDAYVVSCELNLVGLENEIFSAPLAIHWNITGLANEKGISAERQKSSVFFREADEDRDYLSEGSGATKTLELPLNWLAMKQDYFSAALIAESNFDKGAQLSVMVPQDSAHTKIYDAQLPLAMNASSNAQAKFKFYLGPNEYNALKATEVEEFTNIIDYGWWVIGWVNKFMIRPLFWFFSDFNISFGIIILIVTVIIKMVLFPITWKNFLSGAKMRVLKPEIDEINKKYEGKDPVEKQQATMALYRQTGVNPFAGCIPVLLQMPILYAMFRFFPAEIVLRGKSFLWAEDLAAYDSILDFNFNIPMYGDHVSGFTILMAISTFIYSKMSMGSQPTMTQPGMPNMKVMMNIFSFMMIFFFNSMPSGLSLYYFTANMISIGQMWAIKKYFIDEGAIRAKIEENKKKPKKKGGFAARLEEAQKASQARLDANKKKLK